MSTHLGKRKRAVSQKKPARKPESEKSEAELPDAQEIFRRHFEAQFKPLPAVKKKIVVEPMVEDESEEDSDWYGISDVEQNGVQVIEHTDAESRMAAMSKEELKSFMSSKIPKNAPTVSVLRDSVGGKIDDEDASEAANLKKDLALQRLLSESHLLESSNNPTLNGNNRHKATDLRLQALGSKESILRQEKMPMSHRKGIISKASEKETKRRFDARENGIILEKAKMVKKDIAGKRDRGIGAPAVGRFNSGTLRLSKKDIYDIEGPKRTPSTRGRGGGRGGGRGKGKRG
ncbi:uncharacterized protein RAG0_13721 [Rhynchosporium agropyri]|uniref:Uncharacterized protein n=1 Tax=Rhynchosporium agropyri TaxID=914238 RepID=A0A1E1LE77_9HELO|nr:uncharacterized protein RAG0_13721 [Rhynchosporium agropyri]